MEPVLDGPLRAHDLRETLGGCLVAGEVGQHVDRLAGASAPLHAGPVADDLRGVREVDAEGGDVRTCTVRVSNRPLPSDRS